MILGVVDASVALAWGLPDERSAYADAVIEKMSEGAILVPALWGIEVANGLLMGERKKRILPQQVSAVLSFLDMLDIVRDSSEAAGPPIRAVTLAREHELTVYDAIYLELAVRRQLPLATLDKKLANAANRIGVSRWIA